MKTLFDPGLYQFDTPQPSYWEATACTVELQCKPLAGARPDFRSFFYAAITSAPVLIFTGCGIFSVSRAL